MGLPDSQTSSQRACWSLGLPGGACRGPRPALSSLHTFVPSPLWGCFCLKTAPVHLLFSPALSQDPTPPQSPILHLLLLNPSSFSFLSPQLPPHNTLRWGTPQDCSPVPSLMGKGRWGGAHSSTSSCMPGTEEAHTHSHSC